jgi:hypothetical protein
MATVVGVEAAGLDLNVTYETLEAVDEEEDLNAIARAIGEDGSAEGCEKHVMLTFGEMITPKVVKKRDG